MLLVLFLLYAEQKKVSQRDYWEIFNCQNEGANAVVDAMQIIPLDSYIKEIRGMTISAAIMNNITIAAEEYMDRAWSSLITKSLKISV